MIQYDCDKPVIVMGSGPTARNIYRSNLYYTCTVMLASFMCEETDFWVLNDAHVLNDFNHSKLKTIKNLAIPEWPHSVRPNTSWPSSDHHSNKLTSHLKKYMSIHNFNIQTAKKFKLNYDKKLPFFNTTSSGESAIKWLHHKGFNKIITLGLDKEGGRHPDIPGRLSTGHKTPNVLTQKCGPAERYLKCHKRVVEFASNTKDLKIIRLITSEVNEKIIKDLNWEFENHCEIKL